MESFHLRHPSRVSFPLRKGIFVAQLVMVQPGFPVQQASKIKITSSARKTAKHAISAPKKPALEKTGSASVAKQKRIAKATSLPRKKKTVSSLVKKKAASPPVNKKTSPHIKKKAASPPVNKKTSPPVKRKADSLKIHKGTSPSPSFKKPKGVASLGPPTLTKQEHASGDCSPSQKADRIGADSPPVLKKVEQSKPTAEPLKQSTPLKKQSNLGTDVIKPVSKKHLPLKANGKKAALTPSKGSVPPTQSHKPSPATDSSASFQKALSKDTAAEHPMNRADKDTKAFGAQHQKGHAIAKQARPPLKRPADFDDAACSLFQRQLDEAQLVSPPVRKKARRAVSDSKTQSNQEIEPSQDRARDASAPVCVKGHLGKATSPFLKRPNKSKTKAASPKLQKKASGDKLECLPFRKSPESTVSSSPGRKLAAEAKQAIWQGIADRINALGVLPKTRTRLKKRRQEDRRKKDKAAAKLKCSKAVRPCSSDRATAGQQGETALKDARCTSRAPTTNGFRNTN